MDVTEATFATDVVERSHEKPVVVDFWAAWCGPCRTLTPVLEREIEARADAVELAKVDVDANPRLADEYAIRGIPAVKAFRNGRIVSEFVGARPPQLVASFLDELTGPTASEQLLAEAQSRNGDARDEVRRLMLAVFDELGTEHELTQRYRRRLAAALY